MSPALSKALISSPRRTLRAPLRLVVDGVELMPYSALVEAAQAAERQGRRDDARRMYEEALHRPSEAASAGQASSLVRWIARTHQEEGNPEAALDCLDAALAIADANGDLVARGHAINVQAVVRWQQGHLDDAERLYHEARATALRTGESRLAAMTAQNLGVIANIRGEFDVALGHYEASLAAYRVLGLPHDVCVALNNLGKLHTHLGQWERAEAAYTEASQIADVLGNLSIRIMIEVNIAESYVEQRRFDLARQACDQAMSLSKRANDVRPQGELYKVYGIIARECDKLQESEALLTHAQDVAERRQDLLLLAECTKEKAELHHRQGRNRDTLQCLNRSHRIFEQLRASRELSDVDGRMVRLERSFLDVVRKWSATIEAKDRYTQGHCERVADIACALAADTGMDQQSLFWFRIGAMLHDVGKLVVPSEILNKPSKLTDDEWQLMKQHPLVGVEMLADIEFPWDVRPIVESHHERWDGRGYPHGLAGEGIPFTARILCIADVYDALTSERSYKKAFSHEQALDIMRADIGKQFDPELFTRFERVSGDLVRTGVIADAGAAAECVA
jgi:putative nucleotidyltransferase with HDIG domain